MRKSPEEIRRLLEPTLEHLPPPPIWTLANIKNEETVAAAGEPTSPFRNDTQQTVLSKEKM
jgi:hypothetical protein